VERDRIERAVRELLEAIGEDPARPELVGTPERVARMYEEIFADVGRDPGEELDVVFSADYDEMILVRGIPLYSVCEHHLVPWIGRAHVGYVPNKKGQITGLSKLARVVEAAARRPQLQERLTMQVADAIESRLDPMGVIVVVEAEHLCMSMRGVHKPGTRTVTSAVRGVFRDRLATREEAMRLIHGS
jgi:GTP cyclohydrolase I